MLFFDLPFLTLFIFVLPLSYLLKGRTRLLLLLTASYIFYGYWDWRFLGLLIISTFVDYIIGNCLNAENNSFRRKTLVLISVIANLSILGIFKYSNFFLENFYLSFSVPEDQRFFWSFVLPPGISFYTFQTMSYTIDVFRKEKKAERDILAFATFVAFFPQLVAGPIERSNKLIPQIKRETNFSFPNLYIGLRFFTLGCFKKLVIADHLAKTVDNIFSNPSDASLVALWVAAYSFAIQIYCDFSGYADMARGVAKSMGINLTRNFKLPYFSSSLSEFWRRWNITLSYWLRDYVYIPLGGSKYGLQKRIKNIFITFSLSGLWHGASWTFVLWGIMHASVITVEILIQRYLKFNPPKLVKIFISFNIIVLLWVLFRSASFVDSKVYIIGMFSWQKELMKASDWLYLNTLWFYSIPLICFSIWQYRTNKEMPDLIIKSRFIHGIALSIVLFCTILFGAQDASQFIYFQF